MSSDSSNAEEALRESLRAALQTLSRREPFDPTYKRLLVNNTRLANPPLLSRDKFYRKVGSDLRARVELFLAQTAGKEPLDRIAQRQPLEDSAMRASFTLREAKEHEQQAFLDATLALFPKRNGMDAQQRKRYFHEMVLGLQNQKKKIKTKASSGVSEWERQRDQARAREEARRLKEQEENRQNDDMRKAHTPQQALYKHYFPIFKKLWEMEFAHLGGINPFRVVIDRENCASVGAPDYFDIIEKPMNLTYIQQKVEGRKYESLRPFFEDVELMLRNAITYNSDVSNPYRIAAEEMKKMYIKLKKRLRDAIQKKS
ncbi:hypothetical protein FisN_4Hu380 [Fistulifera solaris]|jgi:hypothetical protein|uniref:Bromo domain-containing protein n=1 Tax=Fistulifera solaris TaxID=1519565 RepID=A0A1Z5KQ91_FISSO|nr:hypothetical protein FisN_4Hu380 [Fistulifera solaris]|eukprot:GAX28429.1 hypothetical protein FisN_4Hu380 [Fistulifera solaris]